VGNRFLYPDSSALMVCDKALQSQTADSALEWVDGGLGGLNLATYFQDIKKVLILDYMPNTKHLELFTLEAILKEMSVKEYSHETALYYLLQSLSVILEKVPEVEILSCDPEEENYIQKTLDFVSLWSKHV